MHARKFQPSSHGNVLRNVHDSRVTQKVLNISLAQFSILQVKPQTTRTKYRCTNTVWQLLQQLLQQRSYLGLSVWHRLSNEWSYLDTSVTPTCSCSAAVCPLCLSAGFELLEMPEMESEGYIHQEAPAATAAAPPAGRPPIRLLPSLAHPPAPSFSQSLSTAFPFHRPGRHSCSSLPPEGSCQNPVLGMRGECFKSGMCQIIRPPHLRGRAWSWFQGQLEGFSKFINVFSLMNYNRGIFLWVAVMK